MKFKIKRQFLYHALSDTQSIISGSRLPIVFLKTFDNHSLQITAFDNEIIYQGYFETITEEVGEISISGKSLFEYVKELPDEEIILNKLENNRLNIVCGDHISSKFAGLDTHACPEIPYSEHPFVKIKSADFLDLIQKTIFSVSNDETRPYCTGCFIEISEESNCLAMVSTDGHRMSIAEKPATEQLKDVLKTGVILSKKSMSEFKKLASHNEYFEFSVDKSNAFFRFESTLLTAKLINGKFPNYQVVIPKETNFQVCLEKQYLLSAIRRISTTADHNKNIRLIFNESQLELKSSNPDLGEASEIIPLDQELPAMVLGCNAKYILDVLTIMDEEKLILKFTDDKCPVLLVPDRPESRNLFVIMPVRVIA